MPKVNPFKVPEGYFDTLHQAVAPAGTPALPADSPFRVPMGYFEELPERIGAHLAGEEPELTGIQSDTPFRVPEEYFDTLPRRIRDRVRRSHPGQVRRLQFQFKVVAVAAALVGMILTLAPLLNPASSELARPTRDEVSAYMLANLDDFTDAEIAAFIGDEALLELASTEALINDIDLSNYLLDEVDYYELEDEWL